MSPPIADSASIASLSRAYEQAGRAGGSGIGRSSIAASEVQNGTKSANMRMLSPKGGIDFGWESVSTRSVVPGMSLSVQGGNTPDTIDAAIHAGCINLTNAKDSIKCDGDPLTGITSGPGNRAKVSVQSPSSEIESQEGGTHERQAFLQVPDIPVPVLCMGHNGIEATR